MTAPRAHGPAIAPVAEPDAAALPFSFQMRHGTGIIICTVSAEVLEDASGLPRDSAARLHRKAFDWLRTLIQAAAQSRLSALPITHRAPLVITTEDLRSVPRSPGLSHLTRMPSRTVLP